MGTTVTNLLVTDNFNFDPTTRPYTNAVTTNGQLMIGSTATPNIKVGTLTSPGGTITIGYSSPNITLDLAGGGVAIDSIGVQTGTNPIVPTSGGLVTINGATVAAGTNPVRTDGTGANTMAVEVQISQALAATDATKIGLCNFNSAQFTVDANGFVSSTGGGFTWIDQGTSIVMASNANYFATAGITLTMPSAPAQGDSIRVVVDTASTVVLQANTGQVIRLANSVSSTAGTQTNTAIGDAVNLVYRTTGAAWIAQNSPTGAWTAA